MLIKALAALWAFLVLVAGILEGLENVMQRAARILELAGEIKAKWRAVKDFGNDPEKRTTAGADYGRRQSA